MANRFSLITLSPRDEPAPTISTKANERNPSRLISKSQSAWVNGLARGTTGMGWNCIRANHKRVLTASSNSEEFSTPSRAAELLVRSVFAREHIPDALNGRT